MSLRTGQRASFAAATTACLMVFAAPAQVAGQAPGPPPPVMVGDGYAAAPPLEPSARQPVRVGLPVPEYGPAGDLIVRPNVMGSGVFGGERPFHSDNAAPPKISDPFAPTGLNGNTSWPVSLNQGPESLPPPPPQIEGPDWPGEPGGERGWWPPSLPSMPGPLLTDPSDIWFSGEPLVPYEELHHWARRPRSPTGEAGIGRERVAYAPFEIDITQPFGNIRLRADAAYNLTKPDRAEYFWARPAIGPAPETRVDYQDFRFLMELGSDAFSLGTEIPIRLLNPEINPNTGGLSDIQLVQKTRLLDGGRWQITQLLRTVFNSGNVGKGLGTGHIAMEPGLLCRYQWSDITYIHSEYKFMFPLGADPAYSGPALKWGLGVSTVWFETDTVAYIPTLEFTNIWILDGLWTPPPAGPPVPVDGEGIFNLTPGLRVVVDTGGDLGVVELGAATIFSVGSDGWFDALLRFDLRFVF